MKAFVTYTLFLLSLSLSAQKPLDTILVNEKMNVSLFFESPLRQGITGTDHFVFTYNREKEQYFGLLKARPGTESNLLAITKDGQVYSYILKYTENLSKLNYFISKEKSIGNEKPELETNLCLKTTIVKQNDEIEYYKSFSDYLLRSKLSLMASKRKGDIRLKLQKLAYNKNEVYLVFEIKNKSGIGFEIDDLNVYISNENSRKRSSSQKLKQDIIFKHGFPKLISGQGAIRFVCVLPKFVLDNDEKLLIEVHELNGSRGVVLRTNL